MTSAWKDQAVDINGNHQNGILQNDNICYSEPSSISYLY